MIVIENECVGCPVEMGCLGGDCPYKSVKHYYCDKCGNETNLYEWEEEQLCIACIEKMLSKIE